MTDEPSSSIVAVLLLLFVGVFVSRRSQQRDRPWLVASILLHLVSAVAQVLITWYVFGYGDMQTYIGAGQDIMMLPIPNKAAEIALLFFQRSTIFPESVGSGSVRTMVAIAAFGYAVLGDAPYAICILAATFSFVGKSMIFRAMCAQLPNVSRTRVAIATVLVPSMVFWTSGLLKESVAFVGLGAIVYGIHLLLSRGIVSSIPHLVFGTLIVGLVKPYLLLPCVAAGGLWFLQRNLRSGFINSVVRRPIILALGAIAVILGIAIFSQQFPEYSASSLGSEVARYQMAGTQVSDETNRSGYSIGDSTNKGLAGQLVYIPVGLFTALFRPLLIEVHNPQALVAALESTILLILTVRLIRRQSFFGSMKMIAENPALIFCSIFVLLFGIAVGITSTNLGTLTRYRAPLMPFFVLLILALDGDRRVFRIRPSHKSK